MLPTYIETADNLTLKREWLQLNFLENALLPLAKTLSETSRLSGTCAPVVWLCHAWPTTDKELQDESLTRLLWVTRSLEAAGITVQHELQLATLEAAGVALANAKTLSNVRDWWEAYVTENLNTTTHAWLLGSDSYYSQGSQSGSPLHGAHEQLEAAKRRSSTLEQQPLQIIPFMWAGSGNFAKALPGEHSKEIMADFRTPQKLLGKKNVRGKQAVSDTEGLLDLVESLLPSLSTSAEWHQQVAEYHGLQDDHSDPTEERSALMKNWQVRLASDRNELDKRMDHCPTAIRVLLDGAFQARQQRLVAYWQETVLSRPPFNATDCQTEPVASLAMPKLHQVVAVLGEPNSGKRDVLVGLGQRAATAVMQSNTSNGERRSESVAGVEHGLLGAPLPLWLDMADGYDWRRPDLLDQALQRLGVSSIADRQFMQRYQPLLVLVDRPDEVTLTTNLYVQQNWRDSQVALVMHLDSDYLAKSHEDVDYYLMPNDAEDKPAREQLRYVGLSRSRRGSCEAFDISGDREGLLGSRTEETADQAVSSVSSGSQPSHNTTASTTSTSATSSVSGTSARTLARRYLQQQRHQPALQALAATLNGLADSPNRPKQAFISYAWPNWQVWGDDAKAQCQALQSRLKQLVNDCKAVQVNVMLDIEQLQVGTNVNEFMEREIAKSQAIFLIGTPDLVSRVTFDKAGNPATNVAFEFMHIQQQLGSAGLNVYRLAHLGYTSEEQRHRIESLAKVTYEGDAPTTVFPAATRDWPQDRSCELDLSDADAYYDQLPALWLVLLGLTDHPEAKAAVNTYQQAYQHQEASLSEEAIQAAMIDAQQAEINAHAASAEAVKRIEAERAKFQQQLEKQLQLSEGERVARIIDGIRTKTEAMQEGSFISQTLQQYVPAQASTEADPDKAREQAEDLKQQLDQIAPNSITVLVGTSGSGKSLALHAHAKAAWAVYDEAMNNPTTLTAAPRIPIFMSLPAWHRHGDQWFEKLLEAAGCDTPEEWVLWKKLNPRLQVYCDGLDELPIDQLTQQRFARTFSDFDVTLIVSCRREPLGHIEQQLKQPLLNYLQDDWHPKTTREGEANSNSPAESHAVARLPEATPKANNTVYYVTPFTEQQISEYLDKIVKLPNNPLYGKHAGELHQQLHQMPGLPQLIQTPFVLNLVCQALPRMEAARASLEDEWDQARHVNRADVFAAFLGEWFAKALWRQVHHLGVYPQPAATKQWQRAAQQWALWMLDQHTSTLPASQAYEAVQQGNSNVSFFATEAAAAIAPSSSPSLPPSHAYQTTLLRDALPIRDYENKLSFIHKSVQECLIAQTYHAALQQGDFAQTLLHWNRYPQVRDEEGVLFFLKDMITEPQDTVLWQLVDASKHQPQHSTAASLAATLLNMRGYHFNDKDLSHTHLPNTDFSRAILCHTNFTGATLTHSRFDDAYLDHTIFDEAKMTDTYFGETEAQFIPLTGEKDLIWSPDKAYAVIRMDIVDKGWEHERARSFVLYRTSDMQQLARVHDRGGFGVVLFSPNGSVLAAGGSMAEKTHLLRVSDGQELAVLKTHNLGKLVFSPDGSVLAAGGGYKCDRAHLLRVSDGQELAVLKTHSLDTLVFSPDGSVLAAGGKKAEKTHLLRVSDGWELAVLERSLETLVFSPDGSVLAAGGSGGAHLLQVSDGWELAALLKTKWLKTLVFSPSGSMLAAGGSGGAYLLRVSDGQELAVLETEGLNTLVFSLNGSVLAAGGSDAEKAHLLQVSDGLELAVLETKGLSKLVFSPDGSVLAAGGKKAEKTHLLRVSDGRELAVLETSKLETLVFSPDSHSLALIGRYADTHYLLRRPSAERVTPWEKKPFSNLKQKTQLYLYIESDESSHRQINQQRYWIAQSTAGEFPVWVGKTDTPQEWALSVSGAVLPTGQLSVGSSQPSGESLIKSFAVVVTNSEIYHWPSLDAPLERIKPLTGSFQGVYLGKGKTVDGVADDVPRLMVLSSAGVYTTKRWHCAKSRLISDLSVRFGCGEVPNSLSVNTSDRGGIVSVTAASGENEPAEQGLLLLRTQGQLWQGMRLFSDARVVAFHQPNENHVAFLTASGLTVIHGCHSARPIVHRIPVEDKRIDTLALSPDGSVLAAGGWKAYRAHLLRVSDGRELAVLETRGLETLVFSLDGSVLAAGGGKFAEKAHLLRVSDGQELAVLETKGLSKLVFSPDGSVLAAGGGRFAEKAHLLRVSDGLELAVLKTKELDTLVFSPNGSVLAAGGNDAEKAHLLRVLDGRELAVLKTRNLDTLVFSPDGSVLAAGGEDAEKAHLLRVSDGLELAVLETKGLSKLVFSPDGSVLAARGRSAEKAHLLRVSDGVEFARLPVSNPDLAFTQSGDALVVIAINGAQKTVLYGLSTQEDFALVHFEFEESSGFCWKDKVAAPQLLTSGGAVWAYFLTSQGLYGLNLNHPVSGLRLFLKSEGLRALKRLTSMPEVNLPDLGTASLALKRDCFLIAGNTHSYLFDAARQLFVALPAGVVASTDHRDNRGNHVLLTSSPDRTVRLWDISDWNRVMLLSSTEGLVSHWSQLSLTNTTGLSEVNRLALTERAFTSGVTNLADEVNGESVDASVLWQCQQRIMQISTGDADSQYALAQCYRNGNEGFEQDRGQYAVWLRKAAEQGHSEAAFELSGLYCEGQGVSKDLTVSMGYLMRAVDHGHVEAQSLLQKDDAESQYLLAKAYETGKVIEKNLDNALEWCSKAADQQHPSAAYLLASYYERGLSGLATDANKVIHWRRQAAEWGNSNAAHHLGQITAAQKQELDEQEADCDEDPENAYILSVLYFTGLLGLQSNIRARYWVDRLLENDPAHYYGATLGTVLHHWGANKAQQRDDVAAWRVLTPFLDGGEEPSDDYERASYAQGYRLASDLLCYGRGMDHDLEKADQYLKQAAEWGDVEAQTQWGLHLLMEQLASPDHNNNDAITYLEKAANQGGIVAQWHLVQHYLGQGETTVALHWLSRAAAQGYTPATVLCDRFKAQGVMLPELAEIEQWYQEKAESDEATPHQHHSWGRVQERQGELDSAKESYENTLNGQIHFVDLKRLRALARKEEWTIDQEVQESLDLRGQTLPEIRWPVTHEVAASTEALLSKVGMFSTDASSTAKALANEADAINAPQS